MQPSASAGAPEPTISRARSPRALEHVQEPTPGQVADFAALLTVEPSESADTLAQALADLVASAWAASNLKETP